MKALCPHPGICCRLLLTLVVNAVTPVWADATDPPVQKLPALPSGALAPEATPDGHIYALVKDRLLVWQLGGPADQWQAIELSGELDLTTNAAGELFARTNHDEHATFYRLRGLKAEMISRQRGFDLGLWYVDARERIWFQGRLGLFVLQKGKPPQHVQTHFGPFRPQSAGSFAESYRYRLRPPCEWKPGYVAMFHFQRMVWATPEEIFVYDLPDFAAKGYPHGPYRLGKQLLLAGSGNVSGAYALDVRNPQAGSRQLGIGGQWFSGLATGDGRVLIKSWSDGGNETMFWCEADGKSQVPIKGARQMLLAGYTLPVRFDARNRAYLRLGDGNIAFLDAEQAEMLSSYSGLPFERISKIATVGDQLVMTDAAGQVAVWDTRKPLEAKSPTQFDRQAAWPTGTYASVACVDANGHLWTFLADFPGKVSRFDGQRWRHFAIDIPDPHPFAMTADDQGYLQISGDDESLLLRVKDGTSESFPDHAAWEKSVGRGAKRFFNGSTRRTAVFTNGCGWLFGGEFWDGTASFYDERFSSSTWWNRGESKEWFRADAGKFWRYHLGRWREMDDPPARLLLGPNGLQCFDRRLLRERPKQFVEVAVKGPHAMFARGRRRQSYWILQDQPLVLNSIRVEGDEAFLPVASGGGWVGNYRYFQGVFIKLEQQGQLFETPSGRFLLDEQQGRLRFWPHADLAISGKIHETDKGWTVDCQVSGLPAEARPLVLVLVDGQVRTGVQSPGKIEFSRHQFGGNRIELWALDTLGNVSARPLKFELQPAAGKLPWHPQWHSEPAVVTVSEDHLAEPTTFDLTGGLAVDRHGLVYVTATTGHHRREILRFDPYALRRTKDTEYVYGASVWSLVARAEGVGVGSLLQSPQGDVYVTSSRGIQQPLYMIESSGLGKSEMRQVTYVYNDINAQGTRLAWDDQGNLWNVALRWIGRWNEDRWVEWERPLGQTSKIVPAINGRVWFLSDQGLYTYQDGKMSQALELPAGRQPTLEGFPLQDRHLVLRCERVRPAAADNAPSARSPFADSAFGGWCVYDAKTGELDCEKFADRADEFRSDEAGNLYIWQKSQRKFLFASAQDLSVTELPYVDPPVYWRSFGAAGSYLGRSGPEFLATSSGQLVYAPDEDSLVTWTRPNGPLRHDWRAGIVSGKTHALRKGHDGRVYILRDAQLLVFDPQGRPEQSAEPFAGWEKVALVGRPCAGFEGSIWYFKPDRRTVALSDGTTERTWRLDVEVDPAELRQGLVEIVSDRTEALVYDSKRNWWYLQRDGKAVRVENHLDGLVAMAQQGAKQFHARGYPPVLTADGRIHYGGRLWNGKNWVPMMEGRGFLDGQGELLVVKNPDDTYRRRVYRMKGDRVVEEDEDAERRFFVDDLSVRWFDPAVVEVSPERWPVWSRKTGEISLAAGNQPQGRCFSPLNAMPLGKDRYVVNTRYEGQLLLSRHGLARIDPRRTPLGKRRARPHRLGDGRWAWIGLDSVYIAPQDWKLPEEDPAWHLTMP